VILGLFFVQYRRCVLCQAGSTVQFASMDEAKLREWLQKNGSYVDGLAMYEQVGKDDFLKKLLRKYENEYTREKLRDALQALYDEVKLAADTSSRPVDVPATADFFTLPQTLQELQKEKSRLYSEVHPLRNQLKSLFARELTMVLKGRNRITVKEACEMMKAVDGRKRPIPFSVTFVSLNQERGNGGELIHWEHCTLSNVNATGSREYDVEHFDKKKRTNPRHWMNNTRNVKPLASQDIRKLHIWLMLEFNGAEVMMGATG